MSSCRPCDPFNAFPRASSPSGLQNKRRASVWRPWRKVKVGAHHARLQKGLVNLAGPRLHVPAPHLLTCPEARDTRGGSTPKRSYGFLLSSQNCETIRQEGRSRRAEAVRVRGTSGQLAPTIHKAVPCWGLPPKAPRSALHPGPSSRWQQDSARDSCATPTRQAGDREGPSQAAGFRGGQLVDNLGLASTFPDPAHTCGLPCAVPSLITLIMLALRRRQFFGLTPLAVTPSDTIQLVDPCKVPTVSSRHDCRDQLCRASC